MSANSRNYGTTSSFSSCCFRKDYSYITNGKCLNCKFCYKNTSNNKKTRYRQPGLLRLEYKANPNMLDAPITISKYCDPLSDKSTYKFSKEAVSFILENNGQVIFRTSRDSIDDELKDLFLKNKDNVQFQARVITSDTNTGNSVRENIAPGFSPTIDMLELASSMVKVGIDTSMYFDPLIYGLNNIDILDILPKMESFGLYKMQIRQLFATPYFKKYIGDNVSRRYEKALSKDIGQYFTYDTNLILLMLDDILESAYKYNIEISLCDNKTINGLINKSSNCCQFKNAKAIYVDGVNNRPNIRRLTNEV